LVGEGVRIRRRGKKSIYLDISSASERRMKGEEEDSMDNQNKDRDTSI